MAARSVVSGRAFLPLSSARVQLSTRSSSSSFMASSIFLSQSSTRLAVRRARLVALSQPGALSQVPLPAADVTLLSGAPATSGKQAAPTGPRQLSFWQKLLAAFQIFFPASTGAATARNEAKKRLRMVLYADRCAMSPRTMSDMKKSIVEALSDFVEIDQEDKVDLSVSSDPELGTVYSVSVPVRRVKADYDEDYFNSKFGEGGVVSFDIADGTSL